jgi:hypothetical protein
MADDWGDLRFPRTRVTGDIEPIKGPCVLVVHPTIQTDPAGKDPMNKTYATPWVEIEKRLRATEPEVDEDFEPWTVVIEPVSEFAECTICWSRYRASIEEWVLEEVRKLLVDLEVDPPSLRGSHGTVPRTVRSTGEVVHDPWSLSIDKHDVTFGVGDEPLRTIPTCLVIEAIRLLDQTREAREDRPSLGFGSAGGVF